MAPMQDDTLYNMTDNTEYQANLFAADLLIDDEEIEDMVQNEDLDYFGLCSSLNGCLLDRPGAAVIREIFHNAIGWSVIRRMISGSENRSSGL